MINAVVQSLDIRKDKSISILSSLNIDHIPLNRRYPKAVPSIMEVNRDVVEFDNGWEETTKCRIE
ncbi:hypothetical protein [Candidatus Liberibacter sp.]|uniref:hypothetical protein n=1 Tax=Candidatus Liberibacter sp. TaxID=34022 RepID=UPI0015F525F8|nr:hypothetical protein [Candidatus Liberibacter sp.]MBA5723724.1 hypothetical protein [Candidatus Liberibacter sp.]